MDVPARLLFDSHPDPMWVYDTATLAILEVNAAAVASYGYSRDEFLALTIADIRPPEDVPSLRMRLASGLANQHHARASWRHRRRSGEIIHVEVTSQAFDIGGRPARLVVARDVSDRVAMERARDEAMEREAKLCRAAEDAVRHYQSLLQALPGRYLVLDAATHAVVAASDDYLTGAGLLRETVVGRPLSDTFGATAAGAMCASLARVVATGTPEAIEEPAGVNTPVRDAAGAVTLVVYQPAEVSRGGPGGRDDALALDTRLRAQELRDATQHLQEREASLRNAQRLLGMGVWQMDLATRALRWSDNLYALHGVAPHEFGHHRDAYAALVHPEDRALMEENFASFLASDNPLFSFQHRILRPDGNVVHVRGMAEATGGPDRRMLTGVVRDITQDVEEAAQLAEATELLRIAGRMAKVGGWRLQLPVLQMEWSAETAAIHGLPDVRAMSLDQALAFHVPEHRHRLHAAVEACIRDGTPFDERLQIVDARGRPVWVRMIGEAARDADQRIVALRGALQDVSELVEARQQAEQLGRRLTDVLENISDGFLTMDLDCRYTFLNREAERLLQRPAAALIGRRMRDAFPDAAGSVFAREYEAALADQETRCFTEFFAPLDVWLQVTAYPSPDGLAVYFRDVTRERANLQELRLLQAAAARMSDILLITDAEPIDGPTGPQIVYVNDAFVRRTGYTREEAVGRTPRILQGPATDRAELDRIRTALKAWRPVRAELMNYTKAGEAFWLELDIVPLADERGWFTHWVAIERDVTERKHAEAALRASEERFRLVARATNDIIWDADLITGKVWWNDNGRQLFGDAAAADADGIQGWIDLLHPEDRERVLLASRTAIEGDAEVIRDEYRLVDRTGRTRWMMDRAFIFRDGEGRAIRILGSMADLTDRRELDERLRQAQKLEAVGQLTGGVAHDFNNLLTVILGNSELLTAELEGQPELHQMSEMVMTAAERGAELTNRLLAFARRQALEPRAIDAGALAVGMQGMLRRTLGEHIEIAVLRTPDGWLADVDPGQLEVALLNLAINARDAMPQGGRLTIETANTWLDEGDVTPPSDAHPGAYVTISVSDTGTGMAPEVAARAFEPFFTTKEVGKGSGLGLSMVYGFAKQSGGHARIYSEPGHGTVVRIYLPRARAGQEPAPAQHAATAAPSGHEHVLVVEDDGPVRAHVCGLLQRLGYRVTAAGTGPEALARLREAHDIRLLFTDMVMPGGMDGAELAEAAMAVQPGLKVLLTSGYTEQFLQQGGRVERGVTVLTKPYHRHELATKLRRVLEE